MCHTSSQAYVVQNHDRVDACERVLFKNQTIKRKRRKLALKIVLAAVGVVALGGVAAWGLKKRQGGSTISFRETDFERALRLSREDEELRRNSEDPFVFWNGIRLQETTHQLVERIYSLEQQSNEIEKSISEDNVRDCYLKMFEYWQAIEHLWTMFKPSTVVIDAQEKASEKVRTIAQFLVSK